MTETDSLSTRREPRHALRPGSSHVELDHPRIAKLRCRATLDSISVSGFAFHFDHAAPKIERGTCIDRVSVRVGECLLRGEIVVRSWQRMDETRTEVGCLFYPSPECEDVWMAVNAAMNAVQAG